MIDDGHLIREVCDAIDRTVLDPTQWGGILDTVCDALPGTKATIHVADTHDRSSIGVIQRGFDAGRLAEYEQHYARLNPWMPFLGRNPVLQTLVSDERLPAASFRETEFYQDWLARVGDMESAVGLKLVHEPDRIAVMAVHYGAPMADRYNPLLARLLQGTAMPLRRAVDAARLAARRGATPVPLDAFALPAILLDRRGRALDLNAPARHLIDGRVLSLHADDRLRLGDAALSLRVAGIAAQIAAGRGPCSHGLDLPVTLADGRRRMLSLLAVREPPIAGMPAFFAPSRLTLLLVRPGDGADVAGPAPIERRLGLTPAESRLAGELAAGHSLRHSADRLGIAYHTARTQLKAVFHKAGVSRQAELVALLARSSSPRGPGD